MAEKARRILRRHKRVRSAAYFVLNLARIVTDTPDRNRNASLAAYADALDPWGWDTDWGRRHLALIDAALARASHGGEPLGRGLDFGCGEGWVTERLAGHCRDVVAVDLSPVALARAAERCADRGHITFRRWDIQGDPLLGQFDIVAAICVLEVLLRPSRRRRARRRLLEMLAPTGHLLVMTTKQSAVVELSRWSGLLVRGATGVDRFLMASAELTRVCSEETESHVISLYRHTVTA